MTINLEEVTDEYLSKVKDDNLKEILRKNLNLEDLLEIIQKEAKKEQANGSRSSSK